MASGHSAAHADTVNEGFILMHAGAELQAFKASFDAPGAAISSEEEFAQKAQREDLDEGSQDQQDLYKTLQETFKLKTGLDLAIRFHDSDNQGDCYDDVNGVFWDVDGVYQYSPAGEKFKDFIERKFYVTYG